MFEKVIESLEKNNIRAAYVEDTTQLIDFVKDFIPKGSVVSNGGSVTLAQTGIIDLLRNGDYRFLDRGAEGLTREQIEEIFHKAFNADYYLMSSNAITENGMLYNVDGNSNRVAALMYGPSNVLVIVGKNKIVKDIPAAIERVKTVAAPKNAARLSCSTYCNSAQKCVNADSCDFGGCDSDARICCNYVITSHQRRYGRITVVIVGQELGY